MKYKIDKVDFYIIPFLFIVALGYFVVSETDLFQTKTPQVAGVAHSITTSK